MGDFKVLFERHTSFTLETFPEATPQSSLNKLRAELKEVEALIAPNEAWMHSNEAKAEEYVDCLMCLFDSAARAGISGKEIENAFQLKYLKNKTRKWVKNSDNTYSHVKD